MSSLRDGGTAAIVVLCLCAAGAGPVRAQAADQATLRAEDVLGRAGRTVTLQAKLETEGLLGINPDVDDEPIDFYLVAVDETALPEAEFVGSGRTDDEGIATCEWRPEEPGSYDLEARIRRGSSYVAFPASLHVAAPPPRRSIVLVHLDQTVSEATNLQMWRGTKNEEIAAVEGARSALETLDRHYQLVYLTDLDASFTTKFKDWLALREIPRAPVLFWELFSRSLSHSTYMDKLVAKLRQDFPRAEVGVGGALADADAYLEHGMAGIVLADREELDLEARSEETILASRWPEVVGHVAQIYRTAGLLADVAGDDPAASREAIAALELLGPSGLGYVHRFRGDPDPDVAAAATLVAARIEANEAFLAELDLSTPTAALTSLMAAWRSAEPAVVAELYKSREAGLRDPLPDFQQVELVSRNEPEPGRVVFRLRLLPADAEPFEREVVLVEVEDERWLVAAQDF